MMLKAKKQNKKQQQKTSKQTIKQNPQNRRLNIKNIVAHRITKSHISINIIVHRIEEFHISNLQSTVPTTCNGTCL